MSNITITRRLEIDAGHRLMNHESKCRSAHGHRYVFEIECMTEGALDHVGRVIDFGVVKEVLGGWLDKHWDHAFIYEAGDPVGDWLRANDQRRYELPAGVAPSVENLVTYFHHIARGLMAAHEIRVTQVKIWETPNCYAVSTD